MPQTLFEVAKWDRLDPVSQAANLSVAQASMIFSLLPFITKNDFTFSETYSREEGYSTFRALNEEVTAGTEDSGEMNFSVGIQADKISSDRQTLKVKGRGAWNKQLREKLFGMAATFNESFFKGDQLVNPKAFNGLQTIIERFLPTSQTINENGVGGDPCSLAALDQAIDEVRGDGVVLVHPFRLGDLHRQPCLGAPVEHICQVRCYVCLTQCVAVAAAFVVEQYLAPVSQGAVKLQGLDGTRPIVQGHSAFGRGPGLLFGIAAIPTAAGCQQHQQSHQGEEPGPGLHGHGRLLEGCNVGAGLAGMM